MKLAKNIFLVIILITIAQTMLGQCAMCKAVVESNMQTGESIGKTINNGILYLMAVPYIAMAIIGYLVYNHYKKTNSAE